MNIRSFFVGLCLVGGTMLLLPVHADKAWPDSPCSDQSYWLEFTEMEFCFDRDDIEYLNYLNLSSPSLQITFRPEVNFLPELGLGRLDTQKTTGGLHEHLGLSVRDMFVSLTTGELSEGADKEMVNTVMTIDEATDFHHYRRTGLDAFVILRKSSMWDGIFILDEKREGSIHLTGQFQPADVEWLLARLRW